MKLLRLSSNCSTFQPIDFKDGLNIIVGEKTKNNKETSNGVGKSLSLRCIDFLFGKDKNVDEIKNILQQKDIVLNLSFSQNEKIHFVERSYDKIFFDEKEISLKEYTEILYKLNLQNIIPSSDSILSFRNIFSRFFRIQSFKNPIEQIEKEKVFQNNYVNAFLLKLNLDYLNQKSKLKIKQEENNKIIQQLNEYEQENNKENELELQERLKELTSNLSNFKIAENYYDLEKKLNDITYTIEQMRNEKLFKERQLKNKQKIIDLNKQFDIDIDRISNVYREVQFFFEKSTIEHIEAVKKFHDELFYNRRAKAERDKKALQIEISILAEDIKKMDDERSILYKELENKGALNEYQSLLKEKEKIIEQLEKTQRIKKLVVDLKQKQADIKLEIDIFKRELLNFENEIDIQINKLGLLFREISSNFYTNNKGYLDIKINNSFKTERLYDINARIDADKSNGVNNMKVFIYDMLIYKLNPKLIGFVGHDNLLFDSIDERQIAIALKYVNDNLDQYICSIHDTKFNEANKYAIENNFNLEEHVCVKLSEKHKLFGFDFGKHGE
ncbi:DUF2326 domain-containing protein [Campylobacter jejuni]|uniref:DUF2326 domain-containing protein n=2 Tax=Campylobacter jejuni TaxID=197 RepID=A0A1E7NJ25_CAMJU|nr:MULTISPECIES: DUF2326 domain-containing protein [Campylobacter]EAB5238115.1 DUF2326 domain-containing protein [Campylobacter jejuni]EAB5263968.1 DUF2326 domain-containing protein [Campylobacter jejuni]EAB5317969.1 DUF2326 domain-containing protein [Campylobacter jejuni]EAB5417038.1 DUF2326 domain-containing protein [Campylobacter jejuni]EAH4525459.1 DUF2326 domain-containing protein [Campylobacter jejuni]